MKLESVAIASLVSDPNNARKHDEKNLEAIVGSLKSFGQRKPIVVSSDNVVVAGNGTIEAAKRLGWDKIEVVRVPDDWTADQIKAFALADNRTAELASWNGEVLTSQLRELEFAGFDVAEFGFEPVEIEFDAEELKDEIPELPEEPISKPGDLWQLGDHLLLCGDSTSAASYEKLLGDGFADLIVTDPPWNVNYGATDHPSWKSRTIMNDHMEADEWQSFVSGFVSNFSSFSKPGCPIYLVMSAQEWPVIDATLRQHNFHWSSTIIWAKDRLVLSRKDYHTQYEPVWYGWNDAGPRLSPVEDRKQSDLWQFDRPSRSDLHPTTKPVELLVRMIQNSSKRGDVVLEPFGGSGSTLIACEQTDRKCRAIELDPKYVDVIVKRWETLTGQTATVI